MTRGQRLAIVLVAAAALLLLGRGLAVLYVDRAWYAALGATSVWRAKLWNSAFIYTVTLTVGALFVFLNILTVRRSVMALIMPAWIGDVEIGEEVAASRLMTVALGMSLCAAGVATLAAPSWTTLALWRSNVIFRELDPYFGIDLGYYVTWLPLESALYVWAFVLFAITTLLVITLYVLTPALRWDNGRIHMTTRVRRHITALGAMLMLFTAWGFRLDIYHTLINGNGAMGGMFTHIDHQWLLSLDIIFSVITACAAVILLLSGWTGETHYAFGAVTLAIICCIVAKLVMPWISHAESSSLGKGDDAPYLTIQRMFTQTAFPAEATPPSIRFAADSVLLAAPWKMEMQGKVRQSDVVYPGARGFTIQADSQRRIIAPRVGGFFSRLMGAWAEQNPQTFNESVPSDAAFVRRRDVHDRVAALAPVFMQSHSIGIHQTAVGIVWIVDLYSTSDSYPLSAAHQLGSERLKYRRHAATAYVNGMTGGVTIVPDVADSTQEPIAKTWFLKHSGRYLSPSVPREIAEATPPSKRPATVPTTTPDSTFRIRIMNIYSRMRAALDSGNFRAFGDAFDSLGAATGAR